MDVKLNVGQLAPATTARDLEELFSQAGTVTAVQMLGEAGTTPRRALVTMASRAAAQKAVDLFHQAELDESIITVAFAPLRAVTVGQPGLSAFGQTARGGQNKGGKPGQTRGGHNSALGAFGSGGKSAPTPPRRRGGTQHR